jgi:hypothetical protein
MKPGYRTTEFWVAVLVSVGTTLAAFAEWLPPRYAAFASAVSGAAYSLSRGLAKVYPPKPNG